MAHQHNLTNSLIWSNREPWKASHNIFLFLCIMIDIVVVLIISRIIILILRNNVGEDYIKMQRNAPKFSVIDFTTSESTKNIITKENESLLMATKVPPNEKSGQTKALYSMTKTISLDMDKPKEPQRKITGLPPRDKTHRAEKMRLMSTFDEIGKIEALGLAACRALSENKSVEAEDSSLTAARPQHKDKVRKTEERRLSQTAPPKSNISKSDEPCSAASKVQESDKSEESHPMHKRKLVEENKLMMENTSTASTQSTNKTSRFVESREMTTNHSCNDDIIKKKEQLLLTASKDTRSEKAALMNKQQQPRGKEKNMKLIEVESLSSEDYSALGIKDGTLPVPKNEYQRKLVAIAMRYKIKELQEKKLKQIQERKQQQEKEKLSKASDEPDPKMAIDLRTLSSDRKGSCAGQMESASFEEVCRESISESQTAKLPEGDDDKKDKPAASETKADIKLAKEGSVFTDKHKDLLQMFGNLSEEELMLEATTITLNDPGHSLTEDQDLIDRLDPIRRRWKLPRIDGRSTTEDTRTLSTGDPNDSSPWYPAYRVTAFAADPVAGDRLSETISSGVVSGCTPRQNRAKILLKIGEQEQEISSSWPTDEQNQENLTVETLNDDGSQIKQPAAPLRNRRMIKATKVEDLESERLTGTLPESAGGESLLSAEAEVFDLRNASPLYRLNVNRNRRRLRGIQSQIRMLAKPEESESPKPETLVTSVSISSGDSFVTEATVVSLLSPQMISPLTSSSAQLEGQAVDNGDDSCVMPSGQEIIMSAGQLIHVSEDEIGAKQKSQNKGKSHKLKKPSENKARNLEKDGSVSPSEAESKEDTEKVSSLSRSSNDSPSEKRTGKCLTEDSDDTLSNSKKSGKRVKELDIKVAAKPDSDSATRPRLTNIIESGTSSRQKILRSATPDPTAFNDMEIGVQPNVSKPIAEDFDSTENVDGVEYLSKKF